MPLGLVALCISVTKLYSVATTPQRYYYQLFVAYRLRRFIDIWYVDGKKCKSQLRFYKNSHIVTFPIQDYADVNKM